LLLSANEQQLRSAREFLQRAGQAGRIGRGEDTNFTELNRNRPDPADIHVVSYGLNPQIHAFDNASMVETLEIQGVTVRSARQFVGQLPLLISPITLKPQMVNQAPATGELPPQVDPRQPSQFAAAWTVGSIKYLAESGAESLTYFETVGWLGIMEAEAGTPLPSKFPSRPSQVFPIYYVLHELSPLAGGYVHATTSTQPMSVIGFAVEKERDRRMVLANLTAVDQTTTVQGFGPRVEIRRLDAEHPEPKIVEAALVARGQEGFDLKLPPHGIAVLVAR
jgi:hypothetical protein